jgi:hypothetical protein
MADNPGPYATALDLNRPRPGWVPNAGDADRVTVYQTYADIFNNIKEAFSVKLRSPDGEEISFRYVPAARTIIEAANRYLAKNPEIITEVPPDVTADTEATALAVRALESTFDREQFGAKFMSIKRWTLIKGDGILHVTADPSKAEGTRIRISEVKPDNYFTINDAVDTERIRGVYIVTVVLADDQTTEIAQRIEYRRILTADDVSEFGAPLGSIFYRVGFFESDGWDDRAPFTEADLTAVEVPLWAVPADGAPDYLAGYALPSQITSIPVYHFRNNREGTAAWGRSELQGIETLLAGITQTTTDEDLAVALQGIGVYWTDSGRPRNSSGEEVDWVISPASVLELMDGKHFGRVEGVTTVQPLLDHIAQLQAEVRETTGTPDAAVGRVDVTVAESGIALALDMAPILAKNSEKEEEFRSKLNQFLFDLSTMWLPAYEGINFNGVLVKVVFADPLPTNRAAVLAEITGLVTAQVISRRFAAEIVKEKLGYDIDPVAMLAEIAAEQASALDAAGARLDAAVNDAPANPAPTA